MEVEYSNETEENGIVIQNDLVKYEEAYILNHSQIPDMFSLVETISTILEGIIRETDKLFDSTTTSFQAKLIPDIRIGDYLYRIVKCSECSTEALIMALIYIDRLVEKNGFLIKSLNIHRILLTAIMLAAKFFDDFFYSNGYYAKIGGISNSEMNALEIEFLNSINFSLYVDPVIFFRYRERIVSQR